jgi:hypothetical protein
VRILPGKEQAVFSGIFINATQVKEAAEILENARIEADQDPREEYIIL